MDFKFFLLVVSLISCASAETSSTDSQAEVKLYPDHAPPVLTVVVTDEGATKPAEASPHPPIKDLPEHDRVVTDEGATKAAEASPHPPIKDLPEHDRGKSLASHSGPVAAEAITLYRHDKGAGVYRTESGDLVRMYRVEKSTGKPGRRALPMKPLYGAAEGESVAERQRMFGDWYSNMYNGYGLDPYSSSYSYNYNYGVGGYPYGYGSFYSPYMGYQGYNPFSYGMGMYG